jgi:hypothetical protein
MALNVLQIGRHRFVSGLFWQSLSRRRELAKEALELAKKLNFDMLIVRIDRDTAEAGFANSHEGAQSGMISLGAAVSKAIAIEGAMYDGRQQPAPNWLGAFKVPDGRWAYFAVRDHLFLPNGDWLGTREEVQERLQADYGLGGWNVVIGDEELERLGFHNFYARPLIDLLNKRDGKLRLYRWLALRPVQQRNYLLYGLLLGAALLLAVGVVSYLKHRDNVRRFEAEQALMAKRLHPMALPASNDSARPVHPWLREPLPTAFARDCLARFTEFSPGGWALAKYDCAPAAASYVWDRNGSTIAYLLQSEPRAQIDGDGEHAVLTLPLAASMTADDTLESEPVMRIHLLEAFQTLGVPLKLEPIQVRPDASPRVGQVLSDMTKKPPVPEWRAWRLSANLDGLSPSDVAPLLEQPGVRLNHLAYHDGVWSIEGEVYVK